MALKGLKYHLFIYLFPTIRHTQDLRILKEAAQVFVCNNDFIGVLWSKIVLQCHMDF